MSDKGEPGGPLLTSAGTTKAQAEVEDNSSQATSPARGIDEEKSRQPATGSSSGAVGDESSKLRAVPAALQPGSASEAPLDSSLGDQAKVSLEKESSAADNATPSDVAPIEGAKQWMYLDGTNPTQHGPYSESTVLKLLRNGSAHKDMMAWSQGMAEWQPLGQASLSFFVVFS